MTDPVCPQLAAPQKLLVFDLQEANVQSLTGNFPHCITNSNYCIKM
jgi:hypothetical protein